MMDLVLNRPSGHTVDLPITRDELSTLKQAVTAMQGEMRLQSMCSMCDMDQETVSRNTKNLDSIIQKIARIS